MTGAQVQLLLMAAATMSLTFMLADRLTGWRTVSWAVSLGVGLTATAFIYSSEIYPEFPAALALVLSLMLVTRQGEHTATDGLLLVAVLTTMCWLGVKYAPLALLVSGYFLLRANRQGRIILLTAGAASAGFFAWFHLHLFGGLTPYGVNAVYAGWGTAEILGGHIELGERYYRLWGLLIDRRFGIGRWGPLLLAAIPGMALLAATGPAHRLALGLISLQNGDRNFCRHHNDGMVVSRANLADRVAPLRPAHRADGGQGASLGQDWHRAAGSPDGGDHRRSGTVRPGRRSHHRN